MKKKLMMVISIILLVAIAIGGAYSIDMNRMKNNQPVVFSTWGKKYSPPLKSVAAVMCSVAEIRNEKGICLLTVIFDDEKHTEKKLIVKDKALISKLSKISIKEIIGVNIKANIPEGKLEGMADYYRTNITNLLADYNEFDEYFEITGISVFEK